jgi:hypothetical protein
MMMARSRLGYTEAGFWMATPRVLFELIDKYVEVENIKHGGGEAAQGPPISVCNL